MTSTALKIIGANLEALRKADAKLTSQAKIGAAAGIDQRTVGRILNMENEPTFVQLTKLAKAFRVQPWQLLVPNLEPANPPMLATESEAMRDLLRKIGSTKEAMEGFLRDEGNSVPGEDWP